MTGQKLPPDLAVGENFFCAGADSLFMDRFSQSGSRGRVATNFSHSPRST